MSYHGIPNYEPVWLNGSGMIVSAHAGRLESLCGRHLTDSWLVWDRQYGSWFADCPVLLDFNGEQVEICHQKFDDLSITWNTIAPTMSIEGADEDSLHGSLRFEWRSDADARLAALRGRQLEDIELLEWHGDNADFANGALAVSFKFGRDRITIANGLDENTLEFGEPRSYRRVF